MKLAWTVSSIIQKGYRVIKTRMTKKMVETSKQSSPFGFDSNPSKNYVAIIAETMSNEEPVIVGYLNPKALSSLNVGDSMQYSTDSNGNIKAFLIARNDGTFEFLGTGDFMVRYSALETAFNELKDKHNELINKLSAWVPAATDGGLALKTILFTTPPIVSISVADITKSKIDKIKTI